MNGRMNSVKKLILILVLLTLSAEPYQSQTRSRRTDLSKTRTPLLTGWQFREAGKDKCYPASVPGCVHTDLLDNKLIDDPFYRDNEKKLQWIGRTDWNIRRPSTSRLKCSSEQISSWYLKGWTRTPCSFLTWFLRFPRESFPACERPARKLLVSNLQPPWNFQSFVNIWNRLSGDGAGKSPQRAAPCRYQ